MMEILRTNSSNALFKILILKLDQELSDKYGELQKKYDQYNIIESDTVVIAIDNKTPVGCGCYKKFDNDSAEIKRMFVDKSYRGQGISKKILKELENWAKEKGYKQTLLETGFRQSEAIGLYKGFGYKIIENYGQYIGIETSICMMKQISE
jgi:putative acetyltransferase